MSFGLIPKGSFGGKSRHIYEVNSNEMQNLIYTAYCKYMQIAMYSNENPLLVWAGKLARELQDVIF